MNLNQPSRAAPRCATPRRAALQSISVPKLAHLAEMEEGPLRAQLELMRRVSTCVTWVRGDALQVRGCRNRVM